MVRAVWGQPFENIVIYMMTLILESFKSQRHRLAYSGERERPFWLNVNTFFLNASPTGVCTLGVHVQSIS